MGTTKISIFLLRPEPSGWEWSLIIGRGGLHNRRGGRSEVLPLQKEGRTRFSHAERGGTRSFEVVLTQALKDLAILMGGRGAQIATPFFFPFFLLKSFYWLGFTVST